MNDIFKNIYINIEYKNKINSLDNINLCICNHHISSHNIKTNKCDYEFCRCLQFNNKSFIISIDKGIKKREFWKLIEQEVNLRGLLRLCQ
jgi:hypothetical protein